MDCPQCKKTQYFIENYAKGIVYDKNRADICFKLYNGMLISAVNEYDGEEMLNLLLVDDRIPAGAKLY